MAKQDLDKAAAPEAPQGGTALAELAAYAEFSGSGFENQTSEDYSIPFVTILQALSPQLLPEAGNDHLKQGMIFNTVTGDYYKGGDGIAFIPATTQHEFIEFKPRDQGGGFVGRHAIDSEMVAHAKDASTEFGKYKTPDGNDLIETFAVYGIAIGADGMPVTCVVAFSGSKIKKYKGWMTKAKTCQIPLPDLRRIPAPLWAHRYRLKVVPEKNNKGSFFNWAIEFDATNAAGARLLPNDSLAVEARDLIALVNTGKAKPAYEAGGNSADHDEGGGAGGGKPAF